MRISGFRQGGSGVLCAVALVVFSLDASGQVLNESAKLLASDGAEGDEFGTFVSVSGDTAVVGAPYYDFTGGGGSAYVFVRSGGVWMQQQKLTASDAGGGDRFGTSVSLNGDTTVVGVPYDDDDGTDSGSAYVFVRSGGVWTQQQKLTASDAAAGDLFGTSVSVSGDTAVVGAYDDDDAGLSSGSAYVFVRSGGLWTQQQKLTASDGAAGDEFGLSVSVSADTAAVGAHFDDNAGGDGSAYVFVRSGGAWTQQQKLTASDAGGGDQFGISVSVSGDTVAVGAHLDDDAGTGSGSAYVFVRSAGVWTEQQKLTASDAAAGDHFGTSVSVSGDTGVVGANDAPPSGSAYFFVRAGGVWTQQQELAASDGAAGDQFGRPVSVSGETAVVGAWRDDDNGSNSGSAYVFNLAGTCCISNGTCDAEGNCQEFITQAECEALGGTFLGPGVTCADACVDGTCIPTVSQWGLVALTLALVAAGTVVLRRRVAAF